MKVAYLLPDWPIPPLKGYQRIAYERLRRLSKTHDIDVFVLINNRNISPVTGMAVSVYAVKHPMWRRCLQLLTSFFTKTPFQVAFYRSHRMRAILHLAMERRSYDALVIQTSRLGQYIPKNCTSVSIVDAIDPLPISYRRSLNWLPWYRRWIVREEIRRLTDYECDLARRVDCISIVSDDDLEDYRALLGVKNIAIVPHAVDTEMFTPPSEPRRRGTIVLSGNLGYQPNIEAVCYFCEEVFPVVLTRYPDAELWLVGARPSRKVRNLSRGRNIKLIGPVPDLRPYIGRAVVSVCPVRHRVGIQTKILEAMAMGTPTVSTRVGAAGLGDARRIPVKVADTTAEFADHVIAFLNGKEWEKYSAEGRRFVESRFGLDASIAAFEQLLKRNARRKATRV